MTELMVYGWASVATEHGVPVIDNGGDVIAPREMELAVTKYMEGPALARVMHVTSRRPAGVVLHSFPLTDEIKKALGIQCNREGWIVGVCVSVIMLGGKLV